MSNSPLVSCTILTANNYGKRSHKIDTITIHCMAAPLSVETCGHWFQQSKNSSSNLGIGPDGRIGLYVPEEKGAWCSSNKANDMRAVTIEVASDKVHPYKVTDKAYAALIDLCVDICQRNGIKALVWSDSKADRVNHRNGCNMTVHRDFANKSCPGDYLYARMGQIASAVNARLGDGGNKTFCGKGIGEALCLSSDGMEVRSQARVTAGSTGHVNKGQKVEVLQILKSGWMKIVWPGDPRGYSYTSNVGGKYYQMDLEPSKTPKWVGWVNTGLLNVRSEPKVSNPPNANVIGQLGYKNRVDVCDERDGWYYIRIIDQFGWVAGNYITRV